MKKRVWSMLLTLMAVAALLTVGASAAEVNATYDSSKTPQQNGEALWKTIMKDADDGDTVNIPAGTYYLTRRNTSRLTDKAVTLVGAGVAGEAGEAATNATIITGELYGFVIQGNSFAEKLQFAIRDMSFFTPGNCLYVKGNTKVVLNNVELNGAGGTALLIDSANSTTNGYPDGFSTEVEATNVTIKSGNKIKLVANPSVLTEAHSSTARFKFENCTNIYHNEEGYENTCIPEDDNNRGVDTLFVNNVSINPAPVELTNGGTTTGYFSLQKAIDAAAAGNNTITLKKDISDDVIVTQKEGINIVIDGADKKFSGTINIYGDSRHDKDETLTIQNINFTTNEDGHNFIWSDKADNANREKRYAHNVTVQDCSFAATDGAADVVGLRIRQGYGVDVKRCIATDMHSLMQFSGSRDILVDSVKVTGLSGINLNTAYNVTVQNSEFTVRDHAIRIGAANSASSDSTKSTLKITGNKLTSTGSGDAVIVVRQSSDNVTMTVFKNAISGQKHIEVPEATFSGTISADANYWDGNAAPTVSGTDVEITCYYSDAELTNLVRIGDNGKAYYPVTFNIPEGATIESVSGDVKLIDGAYYLASGPHTVTVTKKGYYEANEMFEVNGASMTVTVELALIPNTYRISVAETANGTVTLNRTRASRNSLITITATPDAGYKAAEVEVTNFRGEEVAVTDAGDGTYTFRMPGSTTNVSVTFECDGSSSEICSSSHLSDVDQTQWYHIAVDYAVSNGLMSGIGEGKFAPEATMERSMVIQVLYNMEGQPAVKYNNAFSDVAADKWYANAIQWGVDNGILVGYGTEFDPAGAISREEMVYMMYNYAQYKGKDTSARGDLSKYADGATTSSWAVEYVKWAVGSGVMVGGNTILNPTGTANRAEVAQIFKNFHEIFG